MNSSELLDKEFIHPRELQNNEYVVFNLPKIYVSASPDHADTSYYNIRAMKYDQLIYFMTKYQNILSIPIEECQNFIRQVFSDLERVKSFDATSTSDHESKTFIFQVLQLITDLHNKGLKFEQNFIPTNMNTHVSFDVIRKYTLNERHMLVSAVEGTWFSPLQQCNVTFYSQLCDEEIIQARIENNDTELNRVQYVLKIYENVLLFNPKFLLDYMIRYLTIIAFKVCLCIHSLNVEGMSDNDLVPHYLCLMLDIIIRTRVITAWQRDPQCAAMLADMACNYEDNFMSNGVLLEKNDIDRVRKILESLRENYADPVVQDMLRHVNINDYVSVLNDSIGVVDNVPYYIFNTQIFERILLSGTMKNINEVYTKTEAKERLNNVINSM
uniref:Tig_6 protein n=1 Tax=Fopius arisanus TaxID=64838 RepID=A0A0C9R2W6_9HYME